VDQIVSALVDQQAELGGLLRGLDDAGWAKPSPCEGWSVADVVLHLAQTNEMAVASAQGRFEAFLEEMTTGAPPAADVDDGAAVMVEQQRGQPNEVLLARWKGGSTELVDELRAVDPHARVTWVAGQLSVRTLATTRLAETWIHTGDVARAIGAGVQPTDRLQHIARLAWRTLPYAFSRAGRQLHGAVAFELRGPQGEAWDFRPDDRPLTVIRGDAEELCLVAGRRVDASDTALAGEGPDAESVLELVRTYA
jgi:uncharacterized protein (TIGR03084 family)